MKYKILTAAFLALIILAGLFFRFQGSSYELPALAYSDEDVLLKPVLNFFETGQLKPPEMERGRQLWYGPFYSNLILLLEILLTYLIKASYHYEAIPVWLFYYLARLLNVFLAGFSLFLLYRLAKLYYNKLVAFAAVMFLAFNLTHIDASIFAKSDMLMSTLILISLLFTYKILVTPKAVYYIFTGLFAGLAVAAKLNAIAVFWPIVTAAFLVHFNPQKGKNIFLSLVKDIFAFICDVKLYLLFLFVFIGYAVGSPFSVIYAKETFTAVYTRWISRGEQSYFQSKYVLQNIGFTKEYFQLIALYFQQALGSIYFFFFFAIGLLHSFFSFKKKLFTLFMFAIGSFLLLRYSLPNAHHYLMVLPVLLLMAASGLAVCVRWIFFPRPRLAAVFFLLAASALLYFSHLNTKVCEGSPFGYLNGLLGKNAKYSKRDILGWIYGNLPIGSKISIDGPWWRFVSKDLYSIEPDINDAEEIKRKNIDYVLINTGEKSRGQNPDFYKFLESQVFMKEFSYSELSRRFTPGLAIYKIKKDKNINDFKFRLGKYTPADGDFAAVKTAFSGKPGEKYALKIFIFDDYNLTDKTCPIFQRVIINGKVVWDYSVADPKQAAGWNEQIFEFIQGEKPTEIIIGVWAQDKGQGISQRPWGAASNTQVRVVVRGKDYLSIPVKWRYTQRGGHNMTGVENFQTKTLNTSDLAALAGKTDKLKFIKNPSFEAPDLNDNWAAKVINSVDTSRNLFKFKLKTDNPAQGASAGIETLFNGIPEERHTLTVYLKDNFPKLDNEGKLWQQILINDEIVWKRDISGEEYGRWYKAVISFLQGRKPAKIEIRITYSSDVSQYNYGRLSPTIAVPNISLDKTARILPAKWEFKGNDLAVLKLDESDKKIFSDYMQAGAFWLDEGAAQPAVTIKAEEGISSDGKRALHLAAGNNQLQAGTILAAGQALAGAGKDALENFSIDYYLDSSRNKGENAKLRLRVIVKSLGGKLLKERIYTIYDAKKKYNQHDFFNRWHTFSRDLKKDFSHFFMDWNKAAFIEIVLEAESNYTSAISVYLDNLRVKPKFKKG